MTDFTPARVKRLRLRLGLTQEGFAPLVRKCSMSVSRWERGKTKVEAAEAVIMEQLEAQAERKGQRRASRAAKGSGK